MADDSGTAEQVELVSLYHLISFGHVCILLAVDVIANYRILCEYAVIREQSNRSCTPKMSPIMQANIKMRTA